MKIYIEVVFLSNFFIDLFLAVFTVTVLKKKVKLSRLILASVVGGIFSAVYPFVGDYRYLLKPFCILSMGIFLCPTKSIKEYFTVVITYLSVTFVLGGIVQFFIGFINTNLRYEDLTYGIIPIIISVGIISIIYLADFLRKEIFKIRQKNTLFYKVKLKNNKCEKNFNAFYDSGNRVYTNNGEAVIFAVERIYNMFASDEEKDFVEIMTASGIKIVPICRTNIEIYFPDGGNIIYKVAMGKLFVPIEGEILLHSDMLGEKA